MTLHPLPLPPSLDLYASESLDFWTTTPPKHTGGQGPEFWERMTPMTVPQYLALRLGRHPTQVSFVVALQTWQRFEARVRSESLERFPVDGYRGILGRTHGSWLFRFDPGRMRRRPPPDHPLAPVLRWVRPDQWFESRFLMAALPQPMRWSDRERCIYQMLRRGAKQGYVLDLGYAELPAFAYRPTRRWCQMSGIAQPRIKESAVEHGVLAVEAALYRADSHGASARVHRLRAEADLTADARAGVHTRDRRFPVIPDLEAELTTGQRYWVEVLSRSYKNEDVAAKFAGLSQRVDFVTTGRTLARRVERAAPRIACHYF